jgi:hypothetical protein
METAEQKMDRVVTITLARVQSMELAVEVLMTQHPNPQACLREWDRLAPVLADRGFDAGSTPAFQEAMRTRLAAWREALDLAANRP